MKVPTLGLPLSCTLFPGTIGEVPARAAWLEQLGYRGLWTGEGRLRRDAVTTLALAAQATRSAYLASGVVPFRTRNVTLLAITWKTLYQLAPGRVRLGLGAWWEPIATRAGLPTERPLVAMREVVGVLRQLFAGKSVSFDGEYVQVREVRFDGPEDDPPVDYPVPLYLAAVGPRMLALGGELADGVLLDFFLPVSYTRAAAETVLAAARSRRLDRSPDLPQLVACCIDDDDPAAAEREIRVVLTRYLVQQPHIARHSGADPGLVEALRRRTGWPATEGELRDAAESVPMSLVRSVTAAGRTGQVADRIAEYLDAGCGEVVVAALGDRRNQTYERLSSALTRRPHRRGATSE